MSFSLKDSAGTTIVAATSYNASTRCRDVHAECRGLASSTTYTATVSGAKDTAGNTMSRAVTWSFTTAAPPGVVPLLAVAELDDPGYGDDGR